jgi:hypothetical protein
MQQRLKQKDNQYKFEAKRIKSSSNRQTIKINNSIGNSINSKNKSYGSNNNKQWKQKEISI